MFEQLIYISTARAMVPSAADVEEILRVSRVNNQRDDLTGLLIVGGRRFLQVLEGPTSALQRAYGHIKNDPRHFAMVELGRKQVADRSFGNWAMGHEQGGTTLLDTVGALTRHLDDAQLKADLVSFAELHSKAA